MKRLSFPSNLFFRGSYCSAVALRENPISLRYLEYKCVCIYIDKSLGYVFVDQVQMHMKFLMKSGNAKESAREVVL